MAKTSVPKGVLKQVHHEFSIEKGWIKMPLREIMFNPRLTGQARQIWSWLAALQYQRLEASWTQCEIALSIGATSRRRSLVLLAEEGFITISSGGGTVTMHDPCKVYEKQRQAMADELCRECSELKGETKEIKSEIVEEPKPKVANKTIDEKQVIIDAWNSCKPDSYAKIRVLSVKQRECINKHLRNLGLTKDDINEFICSVCRGIERSDFWSKKVDVRTRNFNAVFGYGNPNDTKMKNIENLYLDGDPEQVPAEEKPPICESQHEESIRALQSLDYQIDMSNPNDDYVQHYYEQREIIRESLAKAGIDWRTL